MPDLEKRLKDQERQAEELMRKQGAGERAPEEIPPEEDPRIIGDPPPPAEPQPAPEQAAAAPQDPPPAQPTSPGNDDFEKRFVNLKKHHDTLVPQLREELRRSQQDREAFGAERTALLQRITDLQDQATRSAPVVPEGSLTEEEISDIGEELLPSVAKLARVMAQQEISRLENHVAGLERRLSQGEQRTQQVSQVTAAQQFKQSVISQVPTAEQIDRDPEFAQWLNGVDALTGRSRREIATNAWRNADLPTVVNVYRSFEARQPAQPGTRDHLETPGPAGDPPPPSSNQKRTWTSKQIQQFYEKVRRGRISDEKARAVEQDIFAAQKEGRIIG